MDILFARLPSSIVLLEEQHCEEWEVPSAWLGQKVFIIETTGASLDSTEAAARIFSTQTEINLFVSYRYKLYIRPDKSEERSIVYSARAREGAGVDLTTSTVFAGHPCAAGGCKPLGEKPPAFLLTA